MRPTCALTVWASMGSGPTFPKAPDTLCFACIENIRVIELSSFEIETLMIIMFNSECCLYPMIHSVRKEVTCLVWIKWVRNVG